MEVGFTSSQMAKVCSSPAQTRRKWGAENAQKIRLRLDQMVAAPTWAEFVSLPQVRWSRHSDGGELFALELGGGRQMIVSADGGPTPRRTDGQVDLERVDRLIVVEITEPC